MRGSLVAGGDTWGGLHNDDFHARGDVRPGTGLIHCTRKLLTSRSFTSGNKGMTIR
jgi:hypothetical protein